MNRTIVINKKLNKLYANLYKNIKILLKLIKKQIKLFNNLSLVYKIIIGMQFKKLLLGFLLLTSFIIMERNRLFN